MVPTVLSLQWSEYYNNDGPVWFLINGKFINCKYLMNLPYGNQISPLYNAFIEYGHYFVKHIDFSEVRNCPQFQIPYKSYPNLVSLAASGGNEMMDELQRLTELNPNITDISIYFIQLFVRVPTQSLLDSVNSRIDISMLRHLSLQHLRRLIMIPASLHVPNISYIFDKFPNLSELKVKNLILDDISDILVPKGSNDLPNKPKEYPNVVEFIVGNFYTPKSNPQVHEVDGMVVDVIRLYPKLSTLEIHANPFPESADPCKDMIKLEHRELLLFSLSSVSKLIINRIDIEVMNNLRINCLNVRELYIQFISHMNKSEIYDMLQIISQSFPQLIRFEFRSERLRDCYVDEDYDLYDSLFFKQSTETLAALIDNPMTGNNERGLSFEIPLNFNWPHLREVALYEHGEFSPKVLLAFSQFENLEKLKIGFWDLSDIDFVKQRAVGQTISGSQATTSRSNWFPKLWDLKVRLRNPFDYLVQDCVDFVKLFPALKNILISCDDLEEGNAWYEARAKSPHINWGLLDYEVPFN